MGKTFCHYYDHCEDLEEFLHEHNTDQSLYTKRKGPWILKGYVRGESRRD